MNPGFIIRQGAASVIYVAVSNPWPTPANDLSAWAGTGTLQRRCDCGSWSFALMLLDDFPRLVCSRCEMDHTEAMFPVQRAR